VELRSVVALALRLGVRPAVVLDMSEAEFFLCLAVLKAEADERARG
jgi:hypothetical protein